MTVPLHGSSHNFGRFDFVRCVKCMFWKVTTIGKLITPKHDVKKWLHRQAMRLDIPWIVKWSIAIIVYMSNCTPYTSTSTQCVCRQMECDILPYSQGTRNTAGLSVIMPHGDISADVCMWQPFTADKQAEGLSLSASWVEGHSRYGTPIIDQLLSREATHFI